MTDCYDPDFKNCLKTKCRDNYVCCSERNSSLGLCIKKECGCNKNTGWPTVYRGIASEKKEKHYIVPVIIFLFLSFFLLYFLVSKRKNKIEKNL